MKNGMRGSGGGCLVDARSQRGRTEVQNVQTVMQCVSRESLTGHFIRYPWAYQREHKNTERKNNEKKEAMRARCW